jgi:hypothetical protein
MVPESELRKREWPEHVMAEYSRMPYVHEGRLFNRALRLMAGLSEPIPAGECAITSLAAGWHGIVWGATSGTRSHLFAYIGGSSDGVCDLGVIPGARAVRRSLVATQDGTVLGGVSETDGRRKSGQLFRVKLDTDRMKQPHLHRKEIKWGERYTVLPEVEMLRAPVRGECVAALALDEPRGLAYGLSSRTGKLFRVDLATSEVSVEGRLGDGEGFSPLLVSDAHGRVYGAGALGRLCRFDPEVGKIEKLPLSLPTVAGREFYNRLDAACLDPTTGLIYGAGSADGVLFVLDPEALTIRSLGKVIAEPRCRAITVGLDGRVYGIAGEPDGMGHLFCYDPDCREVRDLGLPYAASECPWHGYEFEAACTGPNGEIYLGESDRISHLFIYFPPVRPPS